MTTASPAACQRVNPRSQPPTLPASYTMTGDTTTFYKWKAKFGGLEISDARRLRALEEENVRLKRLLADAMLDNAILKDVAGKKW